MKYQYKYNSLREWMKANKKIKKNTIIHALGVKSNSGFDSWVIGKNPIPTLSLLRLCNTFCVPLSTFVCDLDADGTEAYGVPTLPQEGDVLEPLDGYQRADTERKRGDRNNLDPTDCQVIPSVIPGVNDQCVVNQKNVQNVKRADMAINHASTVVDSKSSVDASAFIELQAKQEERCARLLDIIATQQKQIADLTNMLMQQQNYKRYSGYSIVAEE